MDKEEMRQRAIDLVNAYFNGDEILMKDPDHGVYRWVTIRHPNYWSYLEEFCKNVDKYKIAGEKEDGKEI